MENNNEELKITEARYLIIIPIIITIVCGILDIVANISDDVYKSMIPYDVAVNILRSVIGYLFPSLLSIVVAMLWQQRFKREDLYGIKEDKCGYCLIVTVFYGTCFIACLMVYNLVTAIIFIALTIGYCVIIYKKCLNEKIVSKEKKTQEELLCDYLQRNS